MQHHTRPKLGNGALLFAESPPVLSASSLGLIQHKYAVPAIIALSAFVLLSMFMSGQSPNKNPPMSAPEISSQQLLESTPVMSSDTQQPHLIGAVIHEPTKTTAGQLHSENAAGRMSNPKPLSESERQRLLAIISN